MYTYMTPSQVWYAKYALIGQSMAYAYWHRHKGQSLERYKFAFKVLRNVLIGPHAYTLVFTDGSREELISYDMVCIYNVVLEKS